MIELDAGANGQKVSVQVGELLHLSLPENPTTGYRWKLVSAGDPVLELVRDTFHAPSAERPGRPGSHSWLLRARQPGDACVEVHASRSWESTSSPAEIFILRVAAA